MKQGIILIVVLATLLNGCNRTPDWTIAMETGEPVPLLLIGDRESKVEAFTLLEDHLDKVVVAENSFLKLADQEGNLAEFGPGSYSYRSISKSFYKRAKDYTPLPSKYMSYIWKEMNKPKEQEGVGVTPTVLRDPRASGSSVINKPRFLEIVSGAEIHFNWKPFDDGDQYLLVIKQEDGDWSKVVTLTEPAYNLSTAGLPENSFYHFRVEGGGDGGLFYFAGAS